MAAISWKQILLISLLYLICTVQIVNCQFEAFGGIVAGAAILFNYARCQLDECCDVPYIKFNLAGLKNDLAKQLHGQHLVADTVIRLVQGHVNNPHPAKALVLSFHGWTGSGKNFVSKIIAQNLFKNGMDSKFVNMYIATHHFPHESLSDIYKDNLRREIRDSVSKCGKALFIFDEMDKMPVKVLDAITPFIDHHDHVDGVDYRKTIFLFLSNSGSHVIAEKALDHWRKGLPRDKLSLKDMEVLVKNHAFNDKVAGNGLWHTMLIEKTLISAFVPFLPMERDHVKLCIRDDLRRKDRNHMATDRLLNSIADLLEYGPENDLVYAKAGCKPVSQRVDLALD